MRLSLNDWRASVAEALAEFPLTAPLYGPDGNRSHYTRVSDLLLERFHDKALAMAGFLHGANPTELAAISERFRIDCDVRLILEERNKLRSIGGRGAESRFAEDGPEVARLLVGNVLPLIRDARSVVLFVCEQIDHLDPGGIFSAWTLRFESSPALLPDRALRRKTKDSFPDVTARARFLRYVVAETAESFGMWPERNTAQDLALAHEYRDRFRDIVNWVVAENSRETTSRNRVNFVQERLRGGPAPHAVEWEWHHVAKIDAQLAADGASRTDPITRSLWDRRFDRLGYVTVVLETAPQCYAALARLHRSGEFIERSIRDHIGAPRFSGYEALHTVLTRPGSRPDFPDLIRVHIMTKKSWDARRNATAARHLKKMKARVKSERHASLRVIAHDGRALDLPLGSTVLNFALHIHSALLPRLRGAIVNRTSVGVLHPLQEGDVVSLTLDDTPQLLPSGWEKNVPASTVERIRNNFRREFGEPLEKNGRRWLRQFLARAGRNEISDAELDDYVLEDGRAMVKNQPHLTASYIYRQLGIHDAREQGVDLGHTMFDAVRASAFASAVANRIRENIADEANFEIPIQLAGQFDRIRVCSKCSPSEKEPRSANVADRILYIHRLSAHCAENALTLRRQRPPADDQHYFIVETTNRMGVGAEVLSVFQRHNVDLSELIGRRLAPGWGVFRIGADHIAPERRAQIKAALGSMSGVIRVVSPDEPSVPIFDDLLPAPTAPVPYWIQPAPYQAGPPIDDDRYFYGMGRELTELTHYFDMVAANETSGEFVFVTGPLRVGKTSVVKQFLRRIGRDPSRPHVSIYHFPTVERWTQIAAKVRKKLLDKLPNAPAPVREATRLEDVVVAIREHTGEPVVVVLDEIAGLLAANSAWPEELAAFNRFQERLRGTPGVLVIWIGPALAFELLDPDVRQLLNTSRRLRVGVLEEDEVEALLRAQKMGPAYEINPKKVVPNITQVTAGNPFWISHLALQMFDLAKPPDGSRVITYSHLRLAAAKHRVFLDSDAFADRIEAKHDQANPGARRTKRRILQVFADPRVRLTTDQLTAELAGEATPEEIWRYTEELMLAGSLKAANGEWRIAAPLLGEYIQFIEKMKVRRR